MSNNIQEFPIVELIPITEEAYLEVLVYLDGTQIATGVVWADDIMID